MVFCSEVDAAGLYEHSQMHFHELRHFLTAARASGSGGGTGGRVVGGGGGGGVLAASLVAVTLQRLNDAVRLSVAIVPIRNLARPEQQALMRWVFRNEVRTEHRAYCLLLAACFLHAAGCLPLLTYHSVVTMPLTPPARTGFGGFAGGGRATRRSVSFLVSWVALCPGLC